MRIVFVGTVEFSRHCLEQVLRRHGQIAGEEALEVDLELLYADLQETLARYPPDRMTEGWNTMADGERVFFISTPSAGLWATGARMGDRLDTP